MVETHGALIFLCGDEAHKIRKPLDLGFLDNRTVEARGEQSRREVALGSRLSPDVYTGVLEVRNPDDDEVIEYVVRMRRLPERQSLATIVRSRQQDGSGSRVTDIVGDGLREVARQVAGLHAVSPRSTEIDAAGDPEVIAALWTESLDHLRRLSVGEDAPEIVEDSVCSCAMVSTALRKSFSFNGNLSLPAAVVMSTVVTFAMFIYTSFFLRSSL